MSCGSALAAAARWIALVGAAVALGILSYPIGAGRRVGGIPIPVFFVEPATDGVASLAFVASWSLAAYLLNVCIWVVLLSTAAGRGRRFVRTKKRRRNGDRSNPVRHVS
jgi:hypothetical protein